MVGAGSPNKAVARVLAVTVKTVQFHLGNVYRKLDIASRSELAHLVGARSPELFLTDEQAGSLPTPQNHFIGRDAELMALLAEVRASRLVTLTGVGGVGKTRLALQAAAALRGDFADGVWLVELAPITDPDSVPAAMASALGVSVQPGMTVTASLVNALAARSLLLVVDNCEHVLDAVATVINVVLSHSRTAKVLATSRESLRIPAERLRPVTPFDVDGIDSTAVAMFVDRARAVLPDFTLDDSATALAVAEICRRVDGLALAIELAAAQMVSVTAFDLCGQLDDRFRLLAGPRRGLERHQTMWHAVSWSFDLLDADERDVLRRCSVFAGGFDLPAAVAVAGQGSSKGEVLESLSSLVRKSLVTIDRGDAIGRYGMLETIRQFAEDELTKATALEEVRSLHSRYYADRVAGRSKRPPQTQDRSHFVVTELANLRAAYHNAVESDDIVTAAEIATYSVHPAWLLEQYEPISWAEALIDAAVAADVPQLARLHIAATGCMWLGRPEAALDHALTALALAGDPRYEPIDIAVARNSEGTAHLFAGRPERSVEIGAELAAQTGTARVVGLCALLYGLPDLGRSDEAFLIAGEAVAAARANGDPFYISYALCGFGRAHADADPVGALDALREALAVARRHRLAVAETIIARDAARLEAAHGDLDEALDLFRFVVDAFQRIGDRANLAVALAELTIVFDRIEQFGTAATVYGIAAGDVAIVRSVDLPPVLAHLRSALGTDAFDHCVVTGAAMQAADAIEFVRQRLRRAQRRPRLRS